MHNSKLTNITSLPNLPALPVTINNRNLTAETHFYRREFISDLLKNMFYDNL